MKAFSISRKVIFMRKKNSLTLYYFSSSVSSNFLLDLMKLNIYNGAVIDLSCPSFNYNLKPSANYDDIVKNTLDIIIAKNIDSVIVTIPAKFSFLIHSFTLNAFYFHHSTKDRVVVTKWLNKDKENKIPNYGHFSVGIGGVIFNTNFELLLVKEKYNTKIWKFVTGLVELGETIKDTTLREIREEVGLTDLNYLGTYYIREVYPSNHINDICFFNMCYHSGEKSDVKIDKNELSQAEYFPLSECNELVKNGQTTLITKYIIDNLHNCISQYESTSEKKDYKDNVNYFIHYLEQKKLMKHHKFIGSYMDFKHFDYHTV